MNKNEFFDALNLMEKEKGVPAEFLAEKISNAIVVAARRDYGGNDIVYCNIDVANHIFDVYVRKTVVDEIMDEDTDILIDEAKKISKKAVVGEEVEIKLDTKQFGRIVAQTAKHVIRQGIRDAERGQTLQEFQSRHQELVTALVQRVDPKTGNVTLEIGRNEAVLPKAEQVPGEVIREGTRIRVYIVDVKDSEKGPKVMISRTHPGLVKRLFEMEVPEIFEGLIEIKSISREAGSRTKMAVFSKDPDVDPVGACIGPKGARVNKIVDELGGEKIDIVKYSEDPVVFITEALSPASVLNVEIEEGNLKACHVTVPDSQLSLAIGNKGQNARLAAKLTGWKIDIKPESGFILQ
ncbi:MAG: transcription termination/antitermination protein NusA [Clostridiales bacterium 43-6]|nr:MAG: transcription termination/antitermination protein NusA [Clostridiales bacterium 43-6]